jgi:hypothetical protein
MSRYPRCPGCGDDVCEEHEHGERCGWCGECPVIHEDEACNDSFMKEATQLKLDIEYSIRNRDIVSNEIENSSAMPTPETAQ